MASTSQQQIISQSSAFFKFDVPSYNDWGGLTRAANLAGGVLSDIGLGAITGDQPGSSSTQFAGLLGPSSKAPTLIPNQLAPIDVKSDFAWTSSKADPARAETPYIYLTEKVVDRSSRLQNTMYATTSLLQSPIGAAIGANYGAKLGNIGGRVAGGLVGGPAGAAVGGLIGKVAGGVGGALGSSSIAEGLLTGDEYDKSLKAFSGLYSTTPTNFKYKLPFVKVSGSMSKGITQSWAEENTTLGESMTNISQEFRNLGGAAQSGGLGTLVNLGATAGSLGASADLANKTLSEINKNTFAAAYTETAKTYSYGGAPRVEISFYLFNNLTWADTVKNWHLVFALQYQNLPNRLNRLILSPSVIYEAVVPGYFYSMYTYISSLNVTYLGSTILMEMPIITSDPSDDAIKNVSTGTASPINSYLKVVIPEVYKVEITFESLVPESQNLFYEAMVQSRTNGAIPSTMSANAAAAAAPGGVGQFGSGGMGLSPGIAPGSFGSIPMGF